MGLGVTAVAGKPGQFVYPVGLTWCSGKDMFGGTTFGTVIEAIESASGQSLLSASVQFVRNAQLGSDLLLETSLSAAGTLVTQAQASARQGGELMCSVFATLGASTPGDSAQAAALQACHRMPRAPGPDGCPPRTFQRPIPGSFSHALDTREAGLDPDNADACRLWIRWPGGAGQPMSAAVLAIFADHPPYGIGLVRSRAWYGLTLDSSLRMLGVPAPGADEWVLVEVRFDAIGERFAHATVLLWSSDGRLLAVGAQTLRVRRWKTMA